MRYSQIQENNTFEVSRLNSAPSWLGWRLNPTEEYRCCTSKPRNTLHSELNILQSGPEQQGQGSKSKTVPAVWWDWKESSLLYNYCPFSILMQLNKKWLTRWVGLVRRNVFAINSDKFHQVKVACAWVRLCALSVNRFVQWQSRETNQLLVICSQF